MKKKWWTVWTIFFFDKRTSSQLTLHIKCNESSEGTEHCWLLRVVSDEVTQLQSICSLNVISIVWIAGVMAIDLVWQTIKTCFNWERHHTVILSPSHGSQLPTIQRHNYPSWWDTDHRILRSKCSIILGLHNLKIYNDAGATESHNLFTLNCIITISNTNSFRFQYQCERWCCCCEDCPDK